MNFDRDEKYISDALDALESEITTPDLMQGIRNKMQDTALSKRRHKVLRPMIAAAAIVALLGVTAFAASIGGFDWLLERVKVPFGDVIEETYQSANSSGIKISIIAKKSYSDMSLLYVTLQDTKGLGRVDESTQIAFGENDIIQNYSSKLIYFDRETGIAAYQLRLGAQETFDGQTLKLEIGGISYGKRDAGEIQVDIDLAEAVANGENIGEPYENKTQAPSESLTIGHAADIEGTNSAWLSSIGVLHGYLTVQVGQPSGLGRYLNYNSLRPYLRAPDGTIIEPKPWGTGFVRTKDMQNIVEWSQVAYCFDEHYFDVNIGNLEGYILCFKGSTQELLKGDWKFEIDFDSVTEVIEATADLNVNGVQMNDVMLTLHPLGMTLVGNRVYGDNYAAPTMVDAVIETTDGDIALESHSASRPHPEKEFECIWQANSAIDIDSVIAIRIGNNRIEVQ